MTEQRAILLDQWRTEAASSFEGWDFAALDDRMSDDNPPWSYENLVVEALGSAQRALDLGTGGGEFLSRIADVLPVEMVATEGWPPNLELARQNLAPYGVVVVPYDVEADPHLPFPDDSFDVVLSRHEAYDAAEVARVLAPGGRFLTQQVDGRNLVELADLFGSERRFLHVNVENARSEASSAGLQIVRSEEFGGQTRFSDVGALVYFLQAVPWEVPDDFDVDRYQDQLLALHEAGPAQGRPISFTLRRFYLLAQAPERG